MYSVGSFGYVKHSAVNYIIAVAVGMDHRFIYLPIISVGTPLKLYDLGAHLYEHFICVYL